VILLINFVTKLFFPLLGGVGVGKRKARSKETLKKNIMR
jgi:hypothetical protein